MHEDTPYPDPTRRSGHLYLMTKKHHGAGGPTASCWSLTPENEFRVFDEGDSHRIVESRKIYGVLRVGDELQLIGTWQQVVAIFYPPELAGRWHGHPLFPVRSVAPDSLKGARMKPFKKRLEATSGRRPHYAAGTETPGEGRSPVNRSPLEAGNSRLWKSLLVGRDDISWAGASAGDRGFCFGTEDGDVFLTNFKGLQYGETIVNAAFDDSPEAINGVAFNDGRMVATTRSGSAIWKYAEGKASKRKAGRIGEGSHGVVAALNGAFFLSLNIGGIMSVHENLPSHYSTFVSNSKARDLNIYRTASLATLEGSQVVAVAARSGGVAVGLYKPGCIMGLTAREMPNADFIDICPASYTGFPSSAFALTRDSHVLAFSNVVDVHKPTTISYGGHAGVAYRILSAGEFVCILTSKALHVIHNLVAHSPGSFRVNTRTKSIMFLLDAIDMNLVGQRWLLILLANCVLRLDLQELARDLASEFDEEVSEIIDVWPNATFKNRQLDSHKSEIALVK